MKKLMSGLLIAIMMGSSLVACTNDEVATAAVIVAVVAIGTDNDHNRDCCYRPSRPVYHPAPPHRRPPPPPPPPRRRHWDASIELNVVASEAVATDAVVTTDERVLALAANYGVSEFAATKLVRAITLAQSNDLTGVKELGLDAKDMKNIMKNKEIKAEKIEEVAKNLDMSFVATQEFFVNLTADVQAELASREATN